MYCVRINFFINHISRTQLHSTIKKSLHTARSQSWMNVYQENNWLWIHDTSTVIRQYRDTVTLTRNFIAIMHISSYSCSSRNLGKHWQPPFGSDEQCYQSPNSCRVWLWLNDLLAHELNTATHRSSVVWECFCFSAIGQWQKTINSNIEPKLKTSSDFNLFNC